MKVVQLCLTLCDRINCIVHGILQARILERVAVPFSKGYSQPRDRTQVSQHFRQILYQLSHQGRPGLNLYFCIFQPIVTFSLSFTIKKFAMDFSRSILSSLSLLNIIYSIWSCESAYTLQYFFLHKMIFKNQSGCLHWVLASLQRPLSMALDIPPAVTAARCSCRSSPLTPLFSSPRLKGALPKIQAGNLSE